MGLGHPTQECLAAFCDLGDCVRLSDTRPIIPLARLRAQRGWNGQGGGKGRGGKDRKRTDSWQEAGTELVLWSLDCSEKFCREDVMPAQRETEEQRSRSLRFFAPFLLACLEELSKSGGKQSHLEASALDQALVLPKPAEIIIVTTRSLLALPTMDTVRWLGH